ncbi:MAG: hypothetical protein HQM10_21000 [Candidatus Riflebacteria bacterium]|nr:hypothetical protein [Candidatus Riflebacteria bacterium]
MIGNRVSPCHGRSGSMMLIVMGIIIITGLFGSVLYKSLSDKTNFIVIHSNSTLSDFAAMEIANVFFGELSEALKDSSSSVFRDLLESDISAFPKAVNIDKSKIESKIDFSSRKEFSHIKYSFSGTFADAETIFPSSEWNDKREKLFKSVLQIEISIGKLHLKNFSKSYFFSKPCKIQRLSPAVVSRFSLFVKNPEKTNENSEGYNCFENTIDGKNIEALANSYMPLIVFNNAKVKETELKNNACIFLGGDDEIQLHITSGGNPEYGEFFQFFPITKPENKAPLFNFNNLPGKFSQKTKISDSPILQVNLSVQGAFFGFYVLDNTNPVPQDMNYNRTLGRYFPTSDSKSRTKKSSILHLYGNLKNPSPAMVAGKVKRVFPQYSALMADTDSDGKPDGILAMLNTPSDYQTSTGGQVDFWQNVTRLTTFKVKSNGQTYDVSSFSIKDLFSSKTEYMNFSSKLCMEEYNKVYNYLMDSTKQFPPPDSFKSKTKLDNLINAKDFKILDESSTNTLYKADLNKVTTEKLISDRITMTCSDNSEFIERFVINGKMNLVGQTVLVKKGPVIIPAGVVYENSGVLIVKGNIVIKGGISRQKAGVFSCISSGGDIELHGTNEKIQAFLVALEGTVVNKSTSPVNIEGGIAVEKLHPDSIKSGGTLTYDSLFDPSAAINYDLYSAQISDFYDRWDYDLK